MYTFETTASLITYEVSIDDFKAITQRDQDRQDDDNWNCLSTLLDNIEGVCDTDYNGHFGAAIYFSIDAKYDSPVKRVEITTLILDYIYGYGDFA